MKFNIPSCIVLLLTIGTLSCTRQPVTPQFETLAIDTLLGDSTRGCEIDYRFATIRNADASPALEAIERANIGYFFSLEDFTGSAADAMAVSMHEIDDEFLKGRPEGMPERYLYRFSAEAEAEVRDTLLVYTIAASNYTGGAHGMYGTFHHVYSHDDGYEIGIADLFDEEQLQQLGESIRRKLYERYGAANDEELAAQGFFPDCGIAPNDNFRPTDEGIVFHYNPYEIGCYALGTIEVTIPTEELPQLGKK